MKTRWWLALLMIGGLLLSPATVLAVCGSTTWQLTAGQTINVGTVTVSNDDTNVYVQYTLNTESYPDATFGTLHVWLGNDLENVPATPDGTPIPGQFDKSEGGASFDASGLTAYTFTIPFGDIGIVDTDEACGTELFVLTHAEVDLDSTDGSDEHETAWGGPEEGTGPRWFFYGVYTICCDTTPPVICLDETAFAKGNYVFTTNKRSNPEELESLKLTKNRWGWAINLLDPGITQYDIYAGAGLNKVENGTKVGTLTIHYTGLSATITYTLLSGYTLQEVHVYAGDTPPTTVAPGQYGLPSEGYDANGAVTMTLFDVPLADTDGDGVWIIAHAVVTTSCEP